MSDRTYIHRIDAEDRVVFVNEDWEAFAREAGFPWLAERVLGTPIWGYIRGLEVRHIYRQIVARLRAAGGSIAYPFRCDSPDERRVMELTVEALPNAEVEFRSRLLQADRRAPAAGGDPARTVVTRVVVMCSWCRRIRLEGWIDLEEALRAAGLFADEEFPRISHGICPDCRARVVSRTA